MATFSGLLFFGLLPVLVGCQGNPFSASVDVLTRRWADADLREWRPKLIGQPVHLADELLGQRNDTLTPLDGGPPLIIYPSPRNRRGESFFLLTLAEGDRVQGVGIWKRNRDGLPDIWRVKRLMNACFALPPEECRTAARLGPPLRDVYSRGTGFRALMFDDTGVVLGSRPKIVILCFADDGLCSEVRTVGLLSGDADFESPVSKPIPQAPAESSTPTVDGGQ